MEKNRKRMCAIIVLAITICASTVIPDFAIDVQAATGESNEMIYGADIGFLSQLESQGVQWIDDAGNTRDALVLLKEKGVNAVRLRVFVKPPENFIWTKPDGCLLYTSRCV